MTPPKKYLLPGKRGPKAKAKPKPAPVSRRDKKIAARSSRFSEESPERNKVPGKSTGPRIKKPDGPGRKPTIQEAEAGRGRIFVRLTRERQAFNKDARATLSAIEVDPVKILALAAVGDAVGLGLMTQEDYDQAGLIDAETGWMVEPGGKEIARDLLPTPLRIAAAKDLLPYLYSKPVDVAPGGLNAEDRAQIYLPDNGRTSTDSGEAGDSSQERAAP
jgi:hypothetical protein